MKKHSVYLWITALMFVVSTASGQEKDPYSSALTVNFGTGLNMPINSLRIDRITDHLLEYADQSIYIQPFSLVYFIRPKWGVEMNLQLAGPNKAIELQQNFYQQASQSTENDFFLFPDYELKEISKFGDLSIRKYSLGVVHRMEKSNFIFMPKFLVGLTSFPAYNGTAYRKKRNENTFVNTSYETESNLVSGITLTPELAIGYRVTKHLVFRVDARYTLFHPNFEYTETTQNIFTNEATTNIISYKDWIQSMSIGFGFTLELAHREK